ncbi:hypothetical protein BCR34DRAFT_600525 [Clohesyomyces aquaticus]|uniref:Uncharacterized protein n=1 Tax=Clohesyomyces aquaticus TaxID=1231657 RepID=A0A1Y1ZQV8_9PLEO|nr:hypothetical protein BCR34DRAFT_600525 [Clohesyomyces aquaticus]
MAPRRGGGGGGGGGISVSSCPGAFKDSAYTNSIPYFVDYVLFFVFDIAILIAIFKTRKNYSNSKKLLGWALILSVLFNIIGYALLIIATVLRECYVGSYESYYSWAVAYGVFFNIANYLLLVVVVLFVNSHLRAPLGGSTTVYKVFYGVVLAFMGLMTAPKLGISAYNSWVSSQTYSSRSVTFIREPYYNFVIAYTVFYLLSILGAGALMLSSISQLKKRGTPTHGLIGWAAFLISSLFVVYVFLLADSAILVSDTFPSRQVYIAFAYVPDFFSAMALVAIICIAKHRSLQNWANQQDQPAPSMYPNPVVYQAGPNGGALYTNNKAAPMAQQQPVYAQMGTVPQQQQQFQYANQTNGQPYYYQQQPQQQHPMYTNGTPVNVNMGSQAPELVQNK